MKKIALSIVIVLVVFTANAQTTVDPEIEKKSAEWVTSLNLNNAQKALPQSTGNLVTSLVAEAPSVLNVIKNLFAPSTIDQVATIDPVVSTLEIQNTEPIFRTGPGFRFASDMMIDEQS